jgi:hypothetical protein
MVRHLYNIIESLRQQIRDLEGRALLDPPVPLSFKEDDDLARMRIALDEKIALAVEKWGVNWVAAGLAEFRQLYGGAVSSPVLEGDEEESADDPDAPGEDRISLASTASVPAAPTDQADVEMTDPTATAGGHAAVATDPPPRPPK